MSSITFDNGSEEVKLRGPERHWMGWTCAAIATSILTDLQYDSLTEPHWTRALLPTGHYVLNGMGIHYQESFMTWLRVDGEGMRNPGTGAALDAFTVLLNTAYALGSDPVRLMARIHGQCEIHGFIPPADGLFVADIIQQGRKSGLYRPEMGWEAVTDLLRSSSAAGRPVVMSASVSDSFPGWDSQKDEALDWETAFAALDPTLAISEKMWADYHYMDGTTLLSLKQAAKALKKSPLSR